MLCHEAEEGGCICNACIVFIKMDAVTLSCPKITYKSGIHQTKRKVKASLDQRWKANEVPLNETQHKYSDLP